MTKRYELIHLNGQMYMVDKEAAKKGDKIYSNRSNTIHTVEYDTDGYSTLIPVGGYACDSVDIGSSVGKTVTSVAKAWASRIIATKDPSLGLPLLPEIENDKEIFVVLNPKGGKPPMHHTYRVKAFEDFEDAKKFCEGKEHLQVVSEWIGAAKAKQYTKEDMWDAARFGYDTANNNADDEGTQMTGEEFQAFLQKLRPLPIAVEVEMVEVDNGDTEHDEGGTLPGAVTSELEPVIENGKIVVRKWIY
jgi:hypothetical protein